MKPIKETKYCTLLSQSIIADEEYTYALEKIVVKEQGGREELFIELLKKAFDDNLFSKKFITQLKNLINEK